MEPTDRSKTRTIYAFAIAAAWAACGLGTGIFLSRSDRGIWPAPLRAIAFTDADNHGKSTSRVDTSGGVLSLSTRLDTGAPYPVAGGILFVGQDSQALDLSHGSLELELGSSNLPSLKLCLIEDLPGFTRDDQWYTARHECAEWELLPGTSVYRVPVTEFVTPPWWYSISGVRHSQIGPEKRTRIVRLVFQGAEETPVGQPFDLRIRSISVRTVHEEYLWLGVFAGLFAGLVNGWGMLRRQRSIPAPASPELLAPKDSGISFQPVEVASYADRERKSILECIGRDYPDPELSLEKVSRSTGVPLDRVTSHIKVASGLMFKGYLNRVRGEAAHKLLLETDLPVAEVSQRVGYANVPHFNRVFKELYDTTPTAVREGPQIGTPEISAEDKI